jgi:hypothetical protein
MPVKIALLAAAVFVVGIPGEATGWGREGHEIICEIAFQELNRAARARVIELLRGDRPAYRIFARACNYADHADEDQQDRRSEHYVNVPRHWPSIRHDQCPLADRCLFTAIRKDAGILGSSAPTLRQWRTALKYLGHWVGDLHQPLHVSFADDGGGNDVLLKEEIGCSPNLHAVWDTCIPRDLMSEEGFARSPKGLAQKLHREITNAERATWWGEGVDLVGWANESLAITRRPAVHYCVLDTAGKKCRYSETEDLYDQGAGDSQRRLALTERYEDEQRNEVRTRLKQAGVRLGKMLNELLGH